MEYKIIQKETGLFFAKEINLKILEIFSVIVILAPADTAHRTLNTIGISGGQTNKLHRQHRKGMIDGYGQ
ncbi:hypothetical protein PBY51_021176 [Eleginops maclovinus]|uniref:Uncharacterized protein n=1 Tax=Eleginops maclovinus TaxID=56733 RepID=A0AAN8AH17_ELEMC|nr:hypothetical protein PBY51_021176 [Eleginops maclovinus]